jgi:hypothetical protein
MTRSSGLDHGVAATVRPAHHFQATSLSAGRLTIRQHIETLLAVHEVLNRFLDSRKISQVDMQELQTAVGARMSLLDLLNSRVRFALRASGDIDSAVVLVEDLAQLFANAYESVSMMSCSVRTLVGCTGIAASDDEDTARLVREVLLGECRFGDEEALAEGVQIC